MDGRTWMRRTDKEYDVITLEPMPPTFAGVNNLYSLEFYQAAHDLTVSLARSSSMAVSSRASLFKEQAAFCANQTNGLSSSVSQYEAATIEAEPAAFDLTTLASLSYNFATGKWEDGEAA